VSGPSKILAFAGSAREASYNKKLLSIAIDGAKAAGAEVTRIDLRDFPMPLMDEDLEASGGTPEPAMRLKELFDAHDALLIACPEYNSSITPLLKNTIDWVSRADDRRAPVACYKDKVAAILSASPGALGGLRALVHVRAILGNIGVLVIPDQVSVSRAFEAFAEEGSLKDVKTQASVAAIGARLARVAAALKA
jgi:chromate reductase